MVNRESIDLIRKYIIEQEGKATKSQVVRYMENDVPEKLRLSRDTTIRTIENMPNVIISEGKRRGQAHRLLIEDKKQFNRINKELTEIEAIINSMSVPMRTLNSLGVQDPRSNVPDRWYLQGLSDKFIGPYVDSIGYMLEVLLVQISNEINSQKDAWTLYKEIIELKLKLNEQHSMFEGEGEKNLYLTNNAMIQFYSQDLKEIDEEDLNYAKKYGVPIKSLVKDLITKIHDFKARFLPDPEYPKWGKSTDEMFTISDDNSR